MKKNYILERRIKMTGTFTFEFAAKDVRNLVALAVVGTGLIAGTVSCCICRLIASPSKKKETSKE
jgi:hypothetical protein